MEHLKLAETKGLPRIASIQNPYNLLNRLFEVGLAEPAHREEVSLLAYSPLAMGMLTGKYMGGAKPEGARLTLFSRFQRYSSPQSVAASERYVLLARQHGIDPAQMALAYVNSRPFVTANIIGATSLAQLKSDIDSISVTLPDAVVQGIEVVMDCFFIADVILCTRTAYVQEEDAFLVIDRKSIVRNYMWDGKMSWMTLDIVASVPWTILTLIIQASVPNAGAESLNLIKLAKTPKVFRVGRLLKMIQHLPAAANNIRILILVGFLVIIIHLASGVWYLLHFQRLANEGLYGDATGGVLAPDPYEAYAASFYTTMMSLVGDDVGPESNGEYFFCSVIVLVGAFMNALIFAQVTNLVAQLTAVSQTHQRKMEGIATAMRALRLPKKLTERVNDYYDYIWVRHRDHAGDAFIRSLPYQLRSRISVVVHDQLVRSCALFAEVNTKMIAAIATSLEPEVYLPGEFVVVAGCVSRAMYFISRGKVQLMKRDESRNLTAEEVLQFFNELALFSVSTKTTSL